MIKTTSCALVPVVNTLSAIIFFVALVQLLCESKLRYKQYFLGMRSKTFLCLNGPTLTDYFGIMQAVMVKFAWVFYALMGVSGVEAVVAAASPFVGQVGMITVPLCVLALICFPPFSKKSGLHTY